MQRYTTTSISNYKHCRCFQSYSAYLDGGLITRPERVTAGAGLTGTGSLDAGRRPAVCDLTSGGAGGDDGIAVPDSGVGGVVWPRPGGGADGGADGSGGEPGGTGSSSGGPY